MNEYIELIKSSPDSIKWLGYLLAYLVGLVIFIERLHALFSKSSSDWRAKKAEDLSNLKELIGDDGCLKKINEERGYHDAFFKLAKISVSKERREQLLKVFDLGFLSPRQMKIIAPYLKVNDEGKYYLEIGLSEIFFSALGLFSIFMVGVVMMTVNFISGRDDGLIRFVTMLVGGCVTMGVAVVTRENVMAIRIALIASRKLSECGLLDEGVGFKNQLFMAWRRGRRELIWFSIVLSLLILISWVWALYLKR
ncbi:hypothetical protein [Chromobacterium sp. ASV23]|uniref:hypothetical protein n=1 Tax=Chromobacterium sp. ASV23 TaxID=2795110 RepID=UPI0018EDBBF4|nr:hypothetical protein [Chromobacterium sp. ASV23]